MRDLKNADVIKEDGLAFKRFEKQVSLGATLKDMINGVFKNEFWEERKDENKGKERKIKKKSDQIQKKSEQVEKKIDKIKKKSSLWKAKYLIASRFLGHGINELLKRRKGEEKLTEDEIITKRKSMLVQHKALIVKKLDKLKAEIKFEKIIEKKKRNEKKKKNQKISNFFSLIFKKRNLLLHQRVRVVKRRI